MCCCYVVLCCADWVGLGWVGLSVLELNGQINARCLIQRVGSVAVLDRWHGIGIGIHLVGPFTAFFRSVASEYFRDDLDNLGLAVIVKPLFHVLDRCAQKRSRGRADVEDGEQLALGQFAWQVGLAQLLEQEGEGCRAVCLCFFLVFQRARLSAEIFSDLYLLVSSVSERMRIVCESQPRS